MADPPLPMNSGSKGGADTVLGKRKKKTQQGRMGGKFGSVAIAAGGARFGGYRRKPPKPKIPAWSAADEDQAEPLTSPLLEEIWTTMSALGWSR